MKKIVAIVVMVMGLVAAADQTKAQAKFGYISSDEVIRSMPELKKVDTSLNDFQNALGQQFEDMKREYLEQDSVLNSKDTLKYTKAQLELKRKNIGEIYLKLQGWNNQAQQLLQQKQQELITPLQKKATDAIQAVAKEGGYSYVFIKEAVLVSPPADDLLPLVKKKLGIK